MAYYLHFRVRGVEVLDILFQGCLLGGGKERPLCEIEVELKSGEDGVAAAFAEDLAREFGLVPELKSKLARAMELAL